MSDIEEKIDAVKRGNDTERHGRGVPQSVNANDSHRVFGPILPYKKRTNIKIECLLQHKAHQIHFHGYNIKVEYCSIKCRSCNNTLHPIVVDVVDVFRMYDK